MNAPAAAAPDARALALQRLHASRQRLREELLPQDDADDDAGPATGGRPRRRRWATRWRRLRRRLVSNPAAAVALHALESWWSRHPWRTTAQALAQHTENVVVPWVRRHPVLAVSAGGVAGAALVLGRRRLQPWIRARVSALPSRLLHAAAGLLMQPAVQALLASWVLSTTGPRGTDPTPTEDGGASAPPPTDEPPP